MTNFVLFQMWEPFRQDLIKKHTFYVDQARKRLLSQFEDIEGEADAFADKFLDEIGQSFNPDVHDPGDFYELAHDMAIEHYELLGDMRDTTRLSVITGMFHEWEKQLRDWLVAEIRHWHRGDELKSKIWRANFDQIMELLELLEWKIKSQPFYESLDRCRLVANVYKHGEGGAFNRLKAEYKEFIIPMFDGLLDDEDNLEFVDYSFLDVSDDHLEEFSHAIVSFWENVPEKLIGNDDLKVPDWFNKALIKDQNDNEIGG